MARTGGSRESVQTLIGKPNTLSIPSSLKIVRSASRVTSQSAARMGLPSFPPSDQRENREISPKTENAASPRVPPGADLMSKVGRSQQPRPIIPNEQLLAFFLKPPEFRLFFSKGNVFSQIKTRNYLKSIQAQRKQVLNASYVHTDHV